MKFLVERTRSRIETFGGKKSLFDEIEIPRQLKAHDTGEVLRKEKYEERDDDEDSWFVDPSSTLGFRLRLELDVNVRAVSKAYTHVQLKRSVRF